MGILQKLQKILVCKTDIKKAIENKGVLVGNAPLDQYSTKIAQINTNGNSSISQDADYSYTNADVRFVDYNGKELITMTKAELLALETLPEYPTSHPNLKFEEWNWTLAQAKSYVNKYDCALLGAILTTINGETRYVYNAAKNDLLTIASNIRQTKANGVLIDWGDGTTERTNTNTSQWGSYVHRYAQTGKYTVTYTPDSNCDFGCSGNSYGSIFGYSYESTTRYRLNHLESLYYGRSISSTILTPMSSTLKEIIFPNTSFSLTSTSYCPSLKALIFPKNSGLTSLYAFPNLYSATAISLPFGLSSIAASGFTNCTNVNDIIIPEGPTSIGNSAFSECTSANRIIIPEGVTSIGQSSFSKCVNCKKLFLPEGLLTIAANAFYCIFNLEYLTIPSTVTSIGNYAFAANTYSTAQFKEIHVKPTIPPTLGSGNFATAASVMANYKIYVPAESVDAYKAATNWATFASIIEAEPEESN